jgi:dihydroorotate dehydrogenase
MYKLIRPLLFSLSKDPETVHNLALYFLRLGGMHPMPLVLASLAQVDSPLLEQKVFNLHFQNPVGLAAGFEKNGNGLAALQALGFGFVELGGYTRLPQIGIPRQRIFRLIKDFALINRMGFPNPGADQAARDLSRVKNIAVPLGINLAKSKIIANDQAIEDYLYSFSKLYNYGDYFVINVSSPNTPGLRQLQSKEFLSQIIGAIMEYRSKQKIQKPVLIKTVVDFSLAEIDELLEVCRIHKVDGIVCSNTSVSREGLKTEINEAGGLSGRPISERATAMIKYIHQAMPNLTIIGLGGIFTAEDAYEKIKAGASLVQLYTGFIYEGPFVVKNINRGLIKLLEHDGFKNISEAVGVESK